MRSPKPDTPILSEEGASIPWEERKHWHRFWLIDPVDGPGDFTQRTGEFTVNIALIEDVEPVLGVVTAPALKEAFWGAKGEGAHKRDRTGKVLFTGNARFGRKGGQTHCSQKEPPE